MRVSIPGVPGVYYDTDARSTALTIALTVAGRRAPKPQGYGLQVVPYLWSFEVDLREVPSDHPFQYLHPEGARSLEELSRGDLEGEMSRELDRVLRFAWAVNAETEQALEELLGVEQTDEGIVVEIDGNAADDGLEDGTSDVEDASAVTEIEVTEPSDDESADPDDGGDADDR